MRRARSGAELPSARLVSKDIHNDQSNPSLITTMNHMTFGQFLDHDLDRAPVAKMETDDGKLNLAMYNVYPLDSGLGRLWSVFDGLPIYPKSTAVNVLCN